MLTNQVNILTIIWATLKYKKMHRNEKMVVVNNLWTNLITVAIGSLKKMHWCK